MGTVSEFHHRLAKLLEDRAISVRTWASGGRRSENLLEITTAPEKKVLYVKEFNVPGKPGFLGLTRNQIYRLDRAAPGWFAVLLFRSLEVGYVLTDAQVRQRIGDGLFELSGDGDFKVNEAQDFTPAEHFGSLGELLDRIL